uniref:Uncharacterized protein n=1 Tax=Gossypium raimondii TaxID=29730 RepID=A0A0D2NPG7_GOSRA|nr:hypothetical protein B456_002G178900 [Gossypium raimondii]
MQTSIYLTHFLILSSHQKLDFLTFSHQPNTKKKLFASLYKASTIFSFSSFNCFYHLKAFNLLFFFIQFFPYTMIRKTHKF